ncbi:natriuretic peptide A-like [Mugil cephalus]|uniref:natriuretic peptide A-like n=1 Tax=Mugil cephalus TaxID=48193 RepID=UPI001FB643C6|nr:natriuretic peptide A-like [Mugil cephalus]
MNPNIPVCSLFLWLLSLNVTGGSPVSDLQTLKRLLEEEILAAPFSSSSSSSSLEDMEVQRNERKDQEPDLESVLMDPEERPWDPSDASDRSNSALGDKPGLLERLLKELTRTTKRSWGRYKKGGMRSCFGVRLERIGSFSGLGC